MWRVRFHGRGGHGIKTASRILGTAAFLAGSHAQDSPVYGPERRGAALTAFTRLDARPVGERGAVADPDLILVADETLFADPAAGVLAGGDRAAAVFVNSARGGPELAAEFAIPGPVFAADLTALTAGLLGRGSALSAALGAAACALVGLAPAELVDHAVREELAELRLEPDEVEKNVAAARRAFALLPAVAKRDRPAEIPAARMHPPGYVGAPEGMPVIAAPGNSPQRHTGAWRLVRPVIDRAACTRCGICFALCPDGAILLDADGYPVIDYDNCKGCLICRHECPVHCIAERKEVRAW